MNKFSCLKILGTTLVELMVGLSMGAIATAALIGIYSSGASTTKSVNDITQMSEGVRFVMQELANDISRAGTTSCPASFPVGLYSFEGSDIRKNIVGYTVDGDPYCFTAEGSNDCAFTDENAHLRTDSLTCGSEHLARLGITGYGDSTHWCAKAKAAITNGTALKINPARTVVNLVNDAAGLNEWWENGILYVNAPTSTASNSFFPTKIASSNNLIKKIINSKFFLEDQVIRQQHYAFFRQKIVDYLFPNETKRLNDQTQYAKKVIPKNISLVAQIYNIDLNISVDSITNQLGNVTFKEHLNGVDKATLRFTGDRINRYYFGYATPIYDTSVSTSKFNGRLYFNFPNCTAQFALRYIADDSFAHLGKCLGQVHHSIEGTISGLPSGKELFVAVNGVRVLFTNSSATPILFQTGIPKNTVYTITANAEGLNCAVTAKATGTLTANETGVKIVCTPLLKLLSKVSGLDTGSADVSVNGVLAKTFNANSSTPVLLKGDNLDGTAYVITVSSTSKSCEVVNANGTFSGADVDNIEINCIPLPTPSHTNTAANKFGKTGLLVQYAHIFSNVNSLENQANNVTLTEDIPAKTAGKTVAINSSSPANTAFVISNCSGAHVFKSTTNVAGTVTLPTFSRPYFAGDTTVAPLVSKFYFIGNGSDSSCPPNNLCVISTVPHDGISVTKQLIENISAINYTFVYKNLENNFPSFMSSFRDPSPTERPVGVIINLTYTVKSSVAGLGGNNDINQQFSTAIAIDSAR